MFSGLKKKIRRFKLLGWNKIKPSPEGFIFWHIVNIPRGMEKEKAINAFDRVFEEWQKAFDLIQPSGRWIKLESTSDYDEAHIRIVFVPPHMRKVSVQALDGTIRSYKLPQALDGPGGTLAYVVRNKHIAFFDDEEDWDDMSDIRILKMDLFDVALHEIGHIFDLAHDNDGDSVMTTYYDGRRLKISKADLEDLQQSYGKIKRHAFEQKL